MDSSGSSVEQKAEISGTARDINQSVTLGPKPVRLEPPSPDSHWVERPPYQEVKATLLSQEEGRRTCVVSALHGMGGIGKTWLARALANDPDIRTAMGVLWVTVGQETAGSDGLMHDLITLLAPAQPRQETLNGTQTLLRGLLAEKPYLIVLDDVWEEPIATEFSALLARASPSRLLITTRKMWMVESLGAVSFPLDRMTESESLQLFEKYLGRPLPPEEVNAAKRLAKKVGYLPLALNLIIAKIKQGQSWEFVSDQLSQSLKALKKHTFRRPGQKIEPTLEAVFNTSLHPLRDSTELRVCWEGFIRLSVLAEDTQITPRLARRLLGDEAEEILKLLADEALLVETRSDGGAYQMHDLLQEHGRQLMEDPVPEGRGTPLSQAEKDLLACYGLDCNRLESFETAWQLEEDGYIHPRLVYHLARLQQLDSIEMILNTETPDGRNGWFQAREALGQTGGFVADIEEWRRLIRVHETSVPIRLSKEIRCALLLSTIRSLAANISPSLLEQLVRFELWKPEQALAYLYQAGLQEGKEEAIQTLAALAPHLSPGLLQEALETAQSITDDDFRLGALATLAPHLPEPQRSTTLQEALQIARTITNDYYRSQALTALVPHLPEPQRSIALQEAWQIARFIADDDSRSQALAALAPHLSPSLLHEALQIARTITNDYHRSQALAALVPHLPEKLALETIRTISDSNSRSRVLIALAPHFSPSLLQEALQLARTITDDSYRSKVLVALAGTVPTDRIDFCWSLLEAVAFEERKVTLSVLAGLSLPLREIGGAEVVRETVRAIQDVTRWWP